MKDVKPQGEELLPEFIELERIARDCYDKNGCPKQRFLVQIERWLPCPACGDPVAKVVVNLQQFVADVEWFENDLKLMRPFADLLSEHNCAEHKCS
jgi:hypothetical protein